MTAYRPLLTRVKKEYEDVINAIERGKAEAGYLNDKIQSMAQEPSTLRNYRRRYDELTKRLLCYSITYSQVILFKPPQSDLGKLLSVFEKPNCFRYLSY